jgi:hypothetical protein
MEGVEVKLNAFKASIPFASNRSVSRFGQFSVRVKSSNYSLDRGLYGHQNQTVHCGDEEKNPFPQPGMKHAQPAATGHFTKLSRLANMSIMHAHRNCT